MKSKLLYIFVKDNWPISELDCEYDFFYSDFTFHFPPKKLSEVTKYNKQNCFHEFHMPSCFFQLISELEFLVCQHCNKIILGQCSEPFRCVQTIIRILYNSKVTFKQNNTHITSLYSTFLVKYEYYNYIDADINL